MPEVQRHVQCRQDEATDGLNVSSPKKKSEVKVEKRVLLTDCRKEEHRH